MNDLPKTTDLLLDGKGISLDVYVNDDKGAVYNVEMQRAKKKKLAKRARVIFIYIFDFFDKGGYVYTFENICKEDNKIIFKDEIIKMFLNTRGILETTKVFGFYDFNT